MNNRRTLSIYTSLQFYLLICTKLKKAKKDNAKKTRTEPTKEKSHWKLTFGCSSETDSTETDADMHSLPSLYYSSDENVDSLENELQPIYFLR